MCYMGAKITGVVNKNNDYFEAGEKGQWHLTNI